MQLEQAKNLLSQTKIIYYYNNIRVSLVIKDCTFYLLLFPIGLLFNSVQNDSLKNMKVVTHKVATKPLNSIINISLEIHAKVGNNVITNNISGIHNNVMLII